jgi:hypothetical protein
MHKIVTNEIQPKQYVSLQMILRRNLVWAKYKGIYRIQALDANSFRTRGKTPGKEEDRQMPCNYGALLK